MNESQSQNQNLAASQYPEYAKDMPAGHPVRVYLDENIYLREILAEILTIDPTKEFQKFFNVFNELSEVEKHYARKENQLFPYLEKRGWFGPSQGMWAFHDSNRDLMRAARKKIEERHLDSLQEDIEEINEKMLHMINVEELRLFPISLQILAPEDWKEMREGDEEIGWMLKTKPADYPPKAEVAAQPANEKRKFTFTEGTGVRLDEGFLTNEQINLMLKFMPVDLTYVDENDRVVFYNRGEDRVFPRSAGIIGREVRFCHPPKSVGTVLRILEEFKNGTKNEAEFWIKFKGRVIHIRYFAIRDKDNNYKGVIEMSQDITEIQKLEGEQRLLSWDEQTTT